MEHRKRNTVIYLAINNTSQRGLGNSGTVYGNPPLQGSKKERKRSQSVEPPEVTVGTANVDESDPDNRRGEQAKCA